MSDHQTDAYGLPLDHKLRQWAKKHPTPKAPKALAAQSPKGVGLKIGSYPPIPQESADRIDAIAAGVRGSLAK